VALAILLPVFAVAGVFLKKTAIDRAYSSMATTEEAAPCVSTAVPIPKGSGVFIDGMTSRATTGTLPGQLGPTSSLRVNECR
jgi:hypothetical protein